MKRLLITSTLMALVGPALADGKMLMLNCEIRPAVKGNYFLKTDPTCEFSGPNGSGTIVVHRTPPAVDPEVPGDDDPVVDPEEPGDDDPVVDPEVPGDDDPVVDPEVPGDDDPVIEDPEVPGDDPVIEEPPVEPETPEEPTDPEDGEGHGNNGHGNGNDDGTCQGAGCSDDTNPGNKPEDKPQGPKKP